MKKEIFLYLLIFFKLLTNHAISLENKIIFKINDKIITNFNIKQEEKYLIALNPKLNKINQSELKVIAKDSIIKEKIKEIELIKYFKIDSILDDDNLKKITKNLYQNLGFQEEREFKIYLEDKNLKFSLVKRKLAIEMLWNNLIFKKFNNRVVIDEVEIKNNLDNELKNLSFTRDLLLSEILIRNSKDLKLNVIYLKILESIKNVGFAATANIFSESNTAKIGGKVGWVKETSLSKQILENIINLEKGQISKPIKIDENFLILAIEDTKINKKKINKDKILLSRISYYKNQQLERFSLAYFGKIRQSIQINEL